MRLNATIRMRPRLEAPTRPRRRDQGSREGIRSRQLKTWIVLLVLPGLGFTNCTDFSTTTVPYVDSTDPVVGFRYTAPGSAATTFFGDVSLTTDDYSGQWVLVPFGVDGGGVSELQVFVGWDNTANPPGSGCSVTRDSGWIIPSNDTQPVANPGEPVSNGLYLYKVLRPSDLNSSSNCIVTYEVDVVGTDYAGNESSATFTLTYSP